MSIHALVLCMLAQLIPVKVKVTTRRGRRPFALTARVRPAYSKEVSKAPNLAKSAAVRPMIWIALCWIAQYCSALAAQQDPFPLAGLSSADCLFTRWFSTAFLGHRKCCRGRLGSVRATPPGGQRLDVHLYGPSSNSVCFDVEPEGGALTADG